MRTNKIYAEAKINKSKELERKRAHNTQQKLTRKLDLATRSDAPPVVIISAAESPIVSTAAKIEVGNVVERCKVSSPGVHGYLGSEAIGPIARRNYDPTGHIWVYDVRVSNRAHKSCITVREDLLTLYNTTNDFCSTSDTNEAAETHRRTTEDVARKQRTTNAEMEKMSRRLARVTFICLIYFTFKNNKISII